MNTPDRSNQFTAEGKTLVTDAVRPAPSNTPSDEKIDECKRFGKDLAAAWRYREFGTGLPTVSLLDGSGTVILHYFGHDYVVKFVRAEQYPQPGVLGR